MHFGLKFVRGSGDHGKEFMRKKAVQAFAALLRLLRRGETVVLTADVPKVARVAGLGVVTLAKHSGCPIVPVGLATSRRVRLSNWDRTCINLPFGRMVMVRGEQILGTLPVAARASHPDWMTRCGSADCQMSMASKCERSGFG